MRRADVGALGEGLLADDGQHDPLAAVVHVDLLAGGKIHAGHVGDEAPRLGQLHGVVHAVALGLAVVEEVHVGLAVGFHFLDFGLGEPIQAMLGFVEQFVAQFAHDDSSYGKLKMWFQALV